MFCSYHEATYTESQMFLTFVQANVVTENLQEEEEDTMTRTTCQSHVIGTTLYFTLDFIAVSVPGEKKNV